MQFTRLTCPGLTTPLNCAFQLPALEQINALEKFILVTLKDAFGLTLQKMKGNKRPYGLWVLMIKEYQVANRVMTCAKEQKPG